MFPSFTGLHRPVKGTKVSTVLSTPGQVTIPPIYLDIGMGGHFEGFWGCGGFCQVNGKQFSTRTFLRMVHKLAPTDIVGSLQLALPVMQALGCREQLGRLYHHR